MRVKALDTDEKGRILGWVPPEEHKDYSADYYINQEDCIRCNACLEVCPTRCISVQKVSLTQVRKEDLVVGEVPAEPQFAV